MCARDVSRRDDFVSCHRRGPDFSCAHDGQTQPSAAPALQKALTFLNRGLTMLLKMDPKE